MKMTRLEKRLVNRPAKGAANVQRVAEQLRPLLIRRGARVLELGCGIGDVATYLAWDLGYHVIATDIDEAQLDVARERSAGVEKLDFVAADAGRLQFDDAAFDVVVAQNVLHHIPDWRAAVRELARVLRPGGHLLWLDLTTPAFLKPLFRPVARQVGLYSADEIRRAFGEAGLLERHARELVPALRYELTLQKARAPGME